MNAHLDLDAYLSHMRRDGDSILHLGCRLTPQGARMAADRLIQLGAQGATHTDQLLGKYERAARLDPDGLVPVTHIRDDLRALAAVDFWSEMA